MAWSEAELEFKDDPLIKAISTAAFRALNMFGQQPVMAEAESGGGCPPRAVLSLAHVLAATDLLDEEVYGAISAALSRHAAVLDDGAAGRDARRQYMQRVDAAGGDRPRILLEVPDLCVLWKPPGWTVSVNADDLGTLNSLPHRPLGQGPEVAAGGLRLQDWVAAELGPRCPIAEDVGAQHGLVHRLDRETSGAVACATTYRGYFLTQLLFATRRVEKIYVALCYGALRPGPRLVEVPLRVLRKPDGSWKNVAGVGGRRAVTEIMAVAHLVSGDGTTFSFAQIRLHTGRQHQIRAHFAAEGHPLVGDTTYGGDLQPWCPRTFLHAYNLRLDVPQPDDGGADSRERRVPVAERSLQIVESPGACWGPSRHDLHSQLASSVKLGLLTRGINRAPITAYRSTSVK